MFAEPDPITINVSYSFLHPKSEKTYHNSIRKHVLDHVITILNTGELPHLNPTFSDNTQPETHEIDKNSLLEFISNNGYYSSQDLDVSNDHVKITIPITMIFLNFMSLSDDIMHKIEEVRVKSFLGEFKIGNEEKEEDSWSDLDDGSLG